MQQSGYFHHNMVSSTSINLTNAIFYSHHSNILDKTSTAFSLFCPDVIPNMFKVSMLIGLSWACLFCWSMTCSRHLVNYMTYCWKQLRSKAGVLVITFVKKLNTPLSFLSALPKKSWPQKSLKTVVCSNSTIKYYIVYRFFRCFQPSFSQHSECVKITNHWNKLMILLYLVFDILQIAESTWHCILTSGFVCSSSPLVC